MSALLLTGCGGNSNSTSTATGSAAASATEGADATSEAAPVAEGDTVAGADLAKRMLDAMTSAGSMRVKNEGVNGAGASTADVVIKDGKASSHSTVDVMGSSMEIISLNNGSEVYLKAPSMGLAEWTKVEATSTNPIVQSMSASLAQMKDLMDPAAGLDVYAKAGDFTVAGTEEINGVKATKFTGALPVDALVSAMGAQGEALKAQLGTEPIPVEIYLDEKDRPVKISQTMTVAGQTITSATTYSDFGADITVAAP